MAGTSLYELHNRYLQKPYAVYLYSHSVYIYIAAEVFSQTVVMRHPIGAVRLSMGFDSEVEIILTLQKNRICRQPNNTLTFYIVFWWTKNRVKFS